jgi:hypothetical protein
MDGLDTPEKIKAAFINDCRMYCKDCKYPSEISEQFNKELKKIL